MAKPKKEAKWYRFGRSGDTVDGRIIKEQDILDAVETFNSEYYPTRIWPDHKRWFNLGKVIAIRAEKNDEGGTDMYGQVEANEYYKDMNKMGQRLFFSMELWPDFRKSGKTYLSGLGATDEPASVATSEIHLSRVDEAVIVGESVESAPHYFDSQDGKEGDAKNLLAAIASFFKSQTQSDDDSDDSQEETDMTKEQYEALSNGLTALTKRFNIAFPEQQQAPAGNEAPTMEEQIIALTAQVKDLTDKQGTPPKDEPESGVSKEEFSQLKTALTTLTEQFKAATKEQPGTNGGEHDGDGKDLSACI
uniref:Capsid scaffolding protein n=1 Tax=Marinomonas sp. (strain MWYL1) TaxID=400668 RepID=A6VSU2_MARMS